MTNNKDRYNIWKNAAFPKLETGEIKIQELVSDIKKNLKEFQPFVIEETNHLPEESDWSERLYHIYYNMDYIPTCEICGNKLRFKSFYHGYLQYCSKKCGGKAKGPKTLNEDSRNKLSKNIKEAHKERGNEIVSKRQDTYEKKTGYKHQMHNPEVVSKLRKTMSDRFGCEFALQNPDILESFKQTNKEKYGYETSLLNEEIIKKSKLTRIKKYGYDHWTKCSAGKKYLRELGLNRHKDEINKVLQSKNLVFDDTIEYQNACYPHIWKCQICNKNFKKPWCDIRDGYNCPYCYPKIRGSSKDEQEICEFLSSYNLYIEKNNRNIIYPKELDIYIPDKNIAIEYNGLYWHSDDILVDKNYHLNKTIECEKQGIQLIHIFEDEWYFNKDLIKEMLKQLLNISEDKPKIYARNCNISEVDVKIKNQFLNKFHIQGEDRSKLKLGAFYGDTLVAIMTFSKSNISRSLNSNDKTWELSRFCINHNYHIPGIAGKLLEHFKRNYKWSTIITYADRRWSQGNLYHKLNFQFEYYTKPNYWYIYNMRRIHRFTLKKKQNEPKDIPEWILRMWQGYQRIWDCGHLKFRIRKG